MKKIRGEYIFTSADVWNLDCVLKPIIAGGLKKYYEEVKDNHNAGVPGKFIEATGYDTDDEVEFEKAVKEWHSCIEEMIYAFSAEEPEYTGGFSRDITDFILGNSDEPIKSCTIEPLDKEAYDQYRIDLKVHHTRVDKGAELFGKYFYGLWW